MLALICQVGKHYLFLFFFPPTSQGVQPQDQPQPPPAPPPHTPRGCGGLGGGSASAAPAPACMFNRQLSQQRSNRAEGSASSGGGGGSSAEKAFLGSCLKERKRNCRSLQLPVLYNFKQSSPLVSPLQNCKSPPTLHQKEVGRKKKKVNFLLPSHPPFPLTLPSSLARSFSLPPFCGCRQSLGLALSPTGLSNFLFLNPFSIFFFFHPLP